MASQEFKRALGAAFGRSNDEMVAYWDRIEAFAQKYPTSAIPCYHDKGFEVVGIALEDGKLLASDTPEQTATKMAAAKKILTDFTARENMPWPQYFDGKYWKNDISTKHAINAIPAMFLVDSDGKIVSTVARGPKLEAEVKRLLRL